MGLQSWDIGIGSNCINIAKEFSRNNRVLYVNRAVDRSSSYRNTNDPKTKRRLEVLKGQRPDLVQESENIWVLDPNVMMESINWMPPGLFDFFNNRNSKALANCIKQAAERIGFSQTILFIDNDFFRTQRFREVLKPDRMIYYIRDFLTQQPYFKKHGPRMEAAIMKQADVVVANSSYLANYGRTHNSRSFDIGQGCDFTYFNPERTYSKPEDMVPIKGPVIGYVGALVHFRLDISLLENLAEGRPEWCWVFVGPEDEAFQKSKLHEMPNVFFLGKKEEKVLAQYVSYFDVCLNPQLVNEITIGNYPRKVDEYLALGKPVVATFTDFMTGFLPWVYLSKDQKTYDEAIQKALQEQDTSDLKANRQKFALSHTWENSVSLITKALNSIEQDGK